MKLETEIVPRQGSSRRQADDSLHPPEESLAVTPTTEVPIQVEAGDDFGVTRLGINYKVGDGPEETLHLAGFENQPVTAEGLATLYLEKHKLSFTDAITYYAFVEDNYPAKPHRVVTELRYIDILPYKQAYELVDGWRDLQRGVGDPRRVDRTPARESESHVCFGEGSTVGEETALRLARFEEELAVATAEFADGMTAIAGPVPALDDAVTAMRSATELLTAKDLPAARPQRRSRSQGTDQRPPEPPEAACAEQLEPGERLPLVRREAGPEDPPAPCRPKTRTARRPGERPPGAGQARAEVLRGDRGQGARRSAARPARRVDKSQSSE